MSDTFVGCEGSTVLTTHERLMLAALPDGYQTVPNTALCELEPGHTGMHVAAAQCVQDTEAGEQRRWWIRWDGIERSLTTLPTCPAGLPADVDNGTCILPTCHAGRHSYEWKSDPPPRAHLSDGSILVCRVIEAAPEAAGPPLVFANALGDDMTIWGQVIEQLQPGPRIITYDRSGIGASSPRPSSQRTVSFEDLAGELRRVLDVLHVSEPAVFVGHSIGSLIVRMFASLWPDRVAGMVHVDGTIPELFALAASDWVDGDNPQATRIDHRKGTAEINAIVSYPQVPSIVLVKSPGRWPNPPIPDIDQQWSDGQQKLASQMEAVRIDAANAGHYLQLDVPDLVTLSIRAVHAAAHHGSLVQLDPDEVRRAGGILR